MITISGSRIVETAGTLSTDEGKLCAVEGKATGMVLLKNPGYIVSGISGSFPGGAAPVERKGDIAEWENIFVKDLFI